MDVRAGMALWRGLTPGQRAMLRRLQREGPLRAPGPWEMRTIRSLLERGLVRPRPRGRDGREAAGLWFLSAKAMRILPRETGGAVAQAMRPGA
jgi:hypothetical protein